MHLSHFCRVWMHVDSSLKHLGITKQLRIRKKLVQGRRQLQSWCLDARLQGRAQKHELEDPHGY